MVHKTLASILLLALFQDPPAPVAPTKPDVTVILGRSTVVTEEKDVRRIAIGDSDIIGDVLINPREVLLNAKKPGRTNMITWYADDSPRKERIIHVENDLEFLRAFLKKVDASLAAETSADGQSVQVRGDVGSLDQKVALEADINRMFGVAKADPAKPDAPVAKSPVFMSIGVRNPPATLDAVLADAIKPYGTELRLRRITKGSLPDNATDTFLLEGWVATQTAYTQALIVLDKLLGGPATDFVVVANEGGGLHSSATSAVTAATQANPTASSNLQTTGGGSGFQGSGNSLTPGNLNSNFGRAVAIKGKTDRWISFVQVRSLPQVLVGVRILVLDRSKTKDLGISWDQLLNTTASYLYTRAGGEVTRSFSLVKDGFTLTQVLRFLETKGYIRTLSEPNLVTMSGETATFLVGGDIPIQQVVATSATTLQGTEFREFGIRLSVRPVVGEDGRTVTIDAMPDISEVNALPPSSAVGTTPSFRRTSLRTTAQLKDGEGIVLGGLISTSDEETYEQVAGLGDIPIIGSLFGRTVSRQAEKELAIVLLPRIVYPKPASAFALEIPPQDFRIRAGVYLDPELGTLKSVPDFFHKNLAEGERVPPGMPK